MLVTILDDSGSVMAAGHVEAKEGSSEVILGNVQGSGTLLCYYFQHYGRDVWLENGGVRLRDVLWTCWLGKEREWRVKLRTVAGAPMPPTVPASGSAPLRTALPQSRSAIHAQDLSAW